MATLGGDQLTLLDVVTRANPDGGGLVPLAELLTETNEMLADMPFVEGNLPTGHQIMQRTGLPTTYFRKLGEGVPSSKSTTVKVTETCALAEAQSQVDPETLRVNGNGDRVRAMEAVAFIEAMSQTVQERMLYGNEATAPEEFTGLSDRYSDLSATNGGNIIDAGGSGSDNTSIWLVTTGEHALHGIYPKGTVGGLEHDDKGIVVVQDANGYNMRAHVDFWNWRVGLCLKDWRYVVRIANIDVSDMKADATGASVKLMEYMLKAIHTLPAGRMGKQCFYMNAGVMGMLDIQAMNKSNLQLQVTMEEGKEKIALRGIPFRRVDQLLETEARVI